MARPEREPRVPRVLVADDDPGLRAVVRVALATEGWTILEATTPEYAVLLAKRERPDLIILDVVFEGAARDGFAVCRELKSAEETMTIPVIILTAYDDLDNRALASAVGATAYLAKPFGALDLVRMVRLVHERGTSDPALGLYLIDGGVIQPAHLERALAEQRLRQGDERLPIGEVLIELGFASDIDVRRAIARQQRAREALSSPHPSRILRVVIADDHAGVRAGLQAVITADGSFDIVGIATDGDEALRRVRETSPDLVVLDNDMPKRSGIDVLRTIRAEMPEIEVVMFTLDDRVRDAAMEAGAAAVVMKDVPLRILIAELRRAGTSRVPGTVPTAGVVLAATRVSRVAWGAVARRRRDIAIMGVLLVGYAGAFLVAEPVLGASAAVLAMVPVALAGALLGIEGGIAGALLAALASALLWSGTDHAVGEPVLTVGGNGLGVFAMMGVGAGFGAMRAARGRLNARARRAGALAESALTLAAGPGPDTLALLAEAAVEVVPGDASVLYSAVPGGGLEVVAAFGAPKTLLGDRHVSDAVADAHRHGRPMLLDGLDRSIGALPMRGMQSAIVAPVTVPGERSAGVIVVLAGRRGVYTEAHVDMLTVYGRFVGMAIGSQLRAAADKPALVASPTDPLIV